MTLSATGSTITEDLLFKPFSVKSNTITSGTTTVSYLADTTNIKDWIVITNGKKKRSISGPMGRYAKKVRNDILTCLKNRWTTCLETFSLGTISPNKTYIEVFMTGFQKEGWQVMNLTNGKTIASSDAGIHDSAWSSSGDQLAWVTAPCIVTKCKTKPGVYMTVPGKINQVQKIANLDEYASTYKILIVRESIYVLTRKTRTIFTVREYDRKTGEYVRNIE